MEDDLKETLELLAERLKHETGGVSSRLGKKFMQSSICHKIAGSMLTLINKGFAPCLDLRS